jgi:nitrous oxide reductase accessory protein NosL
MNSRYFLRMDLSGLDQRLIAQWQAAAVDLGIRVTAPVEVQVNAGGLLVCEALVHDFGSPHGGLSMSGKTERRVRASLRGSGLWWSSGENPQSAKYVRKHFIGQLRDWGWFGEPGAEPEWYSAQYGLSG